MRAYSRVVSYFAKIFLVAEAYSKVGACSGTYDKTLCRKRDI